jgi:Cu/Zn superoxide dismutase
VKGSGGQACLDRRRGGSETALRGGAVGEGLRTNLVENTRFMRSVLVATCLLISVLGLAACGGDDEGGAVEQVSSVIETATEAVPESIEVELAEVNASGQSGTATLSPNDDGTLNVTIDLSGGSDEPQPAHIHEGSCPDVGEVVAALNDVVDGTSTSENVDFSLDDLTGAESAGFAINVHKSAAAIDDYVACGDITDVSLP